LEAEISYRRALKLKPQLALAHHNLGVVSRQLGRYKEAEICLRTAIAIVPEYADAFFNLGLVLAKLNQSTEAESNFHLVLKQNPAHTHALIALGNMAANMGQFAQAERYYLQVLAIQPDNLAAWSAIPEIRKMTCDDLGWLRTSLQVLRRCLHPRELSRYYFSMAKYFDDVADPDQAFHHYHRGNELSKLVAAPYQARQETDITNKICTTFSKPALSNKQKESSVSERPVFVVGMPRSGTTLVEQIVASHPLVIGAGELDFWTRAMRHAMPATPSQEIESASVKYLSKAYLKLLNEITRDAVRVIDKAPQNFRNLGLINTVFPNAKIIHMQRNPIDTCLSIYCQDFSSAFSYANDLENLAHYYREYQRLMTHWSATIPASQLLHVPYDALVNDQEGWSRKIIAFIGLDWDQRCMHFQNTVRKVDTASQWQVRQGMYKTSILRWRKYEQYLGPLLGLSGET
jgi:tetratricopeptide (TPR) repeat protein